MKRRALLSLAAVAALAPAAVQASGGEKKKSGGGSYVQIPPLMGSTNKAGGARGVLSVDCGLDVPDPELRIRAEQSTPRLRAAFVQTIQSYAAGLAPGALPSADYIGQALQRQADAILGRPGARVLLGSIIVN
jgi:hypothetical protein